jgi:hypothetical protein
MGKNARNRTRSAAPASPDDGSAVPVVGARQPCPCGSGRRYKACHGRAAQGAQTLVARPFEGLPGECDWVALREIVPAATARLTLAAPHQDADVTVATVLPMAWPALRREQGEILLGLQTHSSSGDPSRDAADALLRALEAEPGQPVPPGPLPGPGPRLNDLIDSSAPFEVTVHDGFDFWIDADGEQSADVRASLERANEAATPTRRLSSVTAAYWCQARGRNHLRWVLPQPEPELLDALARLHAAGASGLGPGTRYVGSFRAHGLLAPVWDLPAETEAAALEEPAQAFGERLGDALAVSTPLSAQERGARNGLLSRQLTLR